MCLACSVSFADDKAKEEAKKKKSPQQQLSALLKKRNDERRAFSAAYSRAKTQAEKQKVFQTLYPKPGKYKNQFMAIARKYPKIRQR